MFFTAYFLIPRGHQYARLRRGDLTHYKTFHHVCSLREYKCRIDAGRRVRPRKLTSTLMSCSTPSCTNRECIQSSPCVFMRRRPCASSSKCIPSVRSLTSACAYWSRHRRCEKPYALCVLLLIGAAYKNQSRTDHASVQ